MKGIFNFKIELDNENVKILVDIQESQELDVNLMGQILKIFANTNKQVKRIVQEYADNIMPVIDEEDPARTDTTS